MDRTDSVNRLNIQMRFQETIRTLQDKNEDGEKVAVETRSIPEIINFKIQAEETKSHAKVCFRIFYALKLRCI